MSGRSPSLPSAAAQQQQQQQQPASRPARAAVTKPPHTHRRLQKEYGLPGDPRDCYGVTAEAAASLLAAGRTEELLERVFAAYQVRAALLCALLWFFFTGVL